MKKPMTGLAIILSILLASYCIGAKASAAGWGSLAQLQQRQIRVVQPSRQIRVVRPEAEASGRETISPGQESQPKLDQKNIGAAPGQVGVEERVAKEGTGEGMGKIGGAGSGNPATIYCIEHCGKSEPRKSDDGSTVGYCVYRGYSFECEEWAFMRTIETGENECRFAPSSSLLRFVESCEPSEEGVERGDAESMQGQEIDEGPVQEQARGERPPDWRDASTPLVDPTTGATGACEDGGWSSCEGDCFNNAGCKEDHAFSFTSEDEKTGNAYTIHVRNDGTIEAEDLSNGDRCSGKLGPDGESLENMTCDNKDAENKLNQHIKNETQTAEEKEQDQQAPGDQKPGDQKPGDQQPGDQQPSGGGEAPSGGGEAPSGGGEAPSGGGEAPSGGGEAPSSGGGAPSGGGEAPSGGGEAPSSGGGAPSGGEKPTESGGADDEADEDLPPEEDTDVDEDGEEGGDDIWGGGGPCGLGGCPTVAASDTFAFIRALIASIKQGRFIDWDSSRLWTEEGYREQQEQLGIEGIQPGLEAQGAVKSSFFNNLIMRIKNLFGIGVDAGNAEFDQQQLGH